MLEIIIKGRVHYLLQINCTCIACLSKIIAIFEINTENALCINTLCVFSPHYAPIN